MFKPGRKNSVAAKAKGADDIAMSCRVRLARNLAGERFPDWATDSDRERVLKQVSMALRQAVPDYKISSLTESQVGECDILYEKHLISSDLLARTSGGGMAISPNGLLCVMINEEDHLRIQGFANGLDMRLAWMRADTLETNLDRVLDFAWTPKLGYLTACPSNVGTGLRASAMLHLPGLRLLEEIDQVVHALERMRFLVRGIGGEGSEAFGQFYQISNMDTLGVSDEAIVTRVVRICAEVVRQERNARLRLQQKTPLVLVDFIARALSVLKSARLLNTSEALEFLSAIRMGISMGLCSRLQVTDVDAMILAMQPGHLQSSVGIVMEPDERDARRAEFISHAVATVKLNC